VVIRSGRPAHETRPQPGRRACLEEAPLLPSNGTNADGNRGAGAIGSGPAGGAEVNEERFSCPLQEP